MRIGVAGPRHLPAPEMGVPPRRLCGRPAITDNPGVGVVAVGVFALVVGLLVFLASWVPLLGIPVGIGGGILVILLGAIGLATRGNRPAAGAGLLLGLLALVFKLIPGVNLL